MSKDEIFAVSCIYNSLTPWIVFNIFIIYAYIIKYFSADHMLQTFDRVFYLIAKVFIILVVDLQSLLYFDGSKVLYPTTKLHSLSVAYVGIFVVQ